MSIARTPLANGHSPKRRKLSHGRDEMASESEKSSTGDKNDQIDSEDEADKPAISNAPASMKLSATTIRKVAAGKAASTSSSSLMSQTQAFLDEVRPYHASRVKKMRPTIDRIIEVIKAIPEQQAMSYAQAQSFSQKTLRVTIPWSQRPATDIKYQFQYAKPTRITVEGPLVHPLGAQAGSRITVVPEMPEQIFNDKDYLNHRCLYKRSFFLACMAAAIREELDNYFRVDFCFLDGNDFLPVIRISDKNDHQLASEDVLEISPSFPSMVGPIRRMTPLHNCLRKNDLPDGRANASDSAECTPLYNSTVRWLSSTEQFRSLLDNAASKADNFRDACMLGAVWLRQRRFSGAVSEGGFGLHEWSLVCALLLESGGHQHRPLFSPRYSTLQLFKAMLQVLSGRDMYDPFVLRGELALGNSSSLPILFDSMTGVNIMHKMTPWSYARLKHYATLSLAALNSQEPNSFEASFLSHVANTVLQYDEVYELAAISGPSTKLSIAQQEKRVYDVLKKGLGDRVQLIDIIRKPSPSWKTTSSAPQSGPPETTVGILIKADTVKRLVDHGPSIEEKAESESFRSFWGEKAELRKFKDGRICESLVWTADSPVTHQIVRYLCVRHLKIAPSSILAGPSLSSIQLRSKISSEEAFATVNTKFQALSSTLHHLDGLPLPIRSVSAASQVARSSSIILPLEPGIAQPIDVMVQFDTSGRWPDNLQAIQYTKIAFLTKLGDLLTKQDRELEVRVGIENAFTSTAGLFNTSFLDVTHLPTAPGCPPLIFRLRIYHERELQLLQQALADKSLRPQKRETCQSALQYMKQNSLARPIHTTAIRSLITQFQPLSTTIRLLKSWISAHHLSQHIPSELLEIISASVFLSPAPWSAPGSTTTAFARCLQFLSQWDWSTQPLIVDLSPSQDLTTEQRTELETRFAAWRQMDPNMNTVTWFVGTNLDSTGVVWTEGTGSSESHPPRVIASRLTALASAAINLINAKSNAQSSIMTKSDWTNIFTSSLEDFDFTIHLKPSLLRGRKNSTKADFKNLQLAANLDVDATGIDNVTSYLKDLADSFGNAAIFFYGAKYSGSAVIGGLWRPHIRGKDAKPWKIRLGYSTVPVKMTKGDEAEGEGMCKINIEGMLAEMGMIGEGLVDKITATDK